MTEPTTEPRPWRRVEARIALASFAIVVVIIAGFLLRDASSLVGSAQAAMFGHIGASAGFTVAATGTLLVILKRRLTLPSILLLGAALTVVMELAQYFAPTRAVQLQDIAAGFCGVMLAGLLINLIFERTSLVQALRVHALGAIVASIALVTFAAVSTGTESADDAAPDGDSCPLSTMTGAGERIMIGADLGVDGCLVTEAGGLGVSDDETALVSSPLSELASSIGQQQHLSVTAQFTTPDFGQDDAPTLGVIGQLTATELGDVLQIRTRNDRVEIFGPAIDAGLRSLVYAPRLKPGQQHLLQVELVDDEMLVTLDGAPMSSVPLRSGWAGSFVDPETDPGLTLIVGNHSTMRFPFQGVIEWIEIES